MSIHFSEQGATIKAAREVRSRLSTAVYCQLQVSWMSIKPPSITLMVCSVNFIQNSAKELESLKVGLD